MIDACIAFCITYMESADMILRFLTFTDPNFESRNFPLNRKFNIYVPRDEQFGHLKKYEFEQNEREGLLHGIGDKFSAKFLNDQFDSFEEVHNLYNETGQFGKFPSPQVIKGIKKINFKRYC